MPTMILTVLTFSKEKQYGRSRKGGEYNMPEEQKKNWEFYITGAHLFQLDSVIEQIMEGDDLTLESDPENYYHPHAMKILYNPGAVMLGFVPKRMSTEVTEAYRQNNNELGCVVLRVTPEAPPYNKLMVRVWII